MNNTEYILLFNDEGELVLYLPFENPTEEKRQKILAKGYDIVTQETYDLIMGVTDGKKRKKNVNGEGYIIIEVPVSYYQENKIGQFKLLRDIEEVKPITVNGHLFDYDNKARERINAAIIALEGQDPIYWTLADNTNVLVSSNDLKDVVRAVAVRSNTLHVKYRQLKEQVLGATTKEEVDAITWTD